MMKWTSCTYGETGASGSPGRPLRHRRSVKCAASAPSGTLRPPKARLPDPGRSVPGLRLVSSGSNHRLLIAFHRHSSSDQASDLAPIVPECRGPLTHTLSSYGFGEDYSSEMLPGNAFAFLPLARFTQFACLCRFQSRV